MLRLYKKYNELAEKYGDTPIGFLVIIGLMTSIALAFSLDSPLSLWVKIPLGIISCSMVFIRMYESLRKLNTKKQDNGLEKNDDTIELGGALESEQPLQFIGEGNPNISFYIKGETIVSLEGNGDIYVKGKLIENDKELVEGLREFLRKSYEFQK